MVKFLTEYYNHFSNIKDKDLYCFTYEDMVNKPMDILPLVFDFIGVEYNIDRLEKAMKVITKESLHKHNKRLSDTSQKYADNRELFFENYKQK